MREKQGGSAVVTPDALVPSRRRTLDQTFIVLFFVSLGGLACALWASGDVAIMYTVPAVLLVLLTQAGAAFGRRLRVQVRASAFTFASFIGVALALPELGSGMPVILVSTVTTVGCVALLARLLEQSMEHRAIPVRQSPGFAASDAPTFERANSHHSPRASELQTLGLLAATLTHDFNNLLSVVLANTSALKAQLTSNVEEVEEIEHVAHEAADLCQRVLTMTREPMAPMEESNLNHLVLAELPLLRRLVSSRVRVVWEPGPDLWFLASRTEFRQVLLNLCANARDAMPRGGELKLRTVASNRPALASDEPEAFAGLIVSDTGVGMDEATKAQIFHPFFTTKAPSNGTGLGMAVVLAAVERHKACIEVDSRPNVGTTISIFFPEIVAVHASESVPTQSMTRQLAGKETILVVEDDARVLRAICRTLRRHGYRVLAAADGREGLAVLKLHRVDLVVCDAVMPNVDGPTLFRQVARTDPRLPFLFCSGSAEEFVHLEGASDPAPRLLKPFSEESLLLKVRELLAAYDESSPEPTRMQAASE